MKFNKALNEEVKPGHKRLAIAASGSATGTKVKNYLHKLDVFGATKDLKKSAKKNGLKSKDVEAYKWAVFT